MSEVDSMGRFHSFRFKTESTGKPTYVYMDGKKLENITSANVDWDVYDIPRVTLTLLTTNIEMDIEDGQAEVKKE